MERKEYDIVKLARARHWFEQQKDVHKDVFNYYNLEWYGKIRSEADKDVQLPPKYIEETKKLVEGMLIRFTTLTLSYTEEEEWIFWEVEDIVQGWMHFDTLEVNAAERKLVLEGEKEVLERVNAALEAMIQEWKKDSLEKTRRQLEKRGINLNRITDRQLEILDRLRHDGILHNCLKALFCASRSSGSWQTPSVTTLNRTVISASALIMPCLAKIYQRDRASRRGSFRRGISHRAGPDR